MGLNDFQISEMRSLASFYSNTPAQNDSGGRDDVWTLVVSTRGRLRKNSGSKNNEQGQVGFGKNYEFICWFQTALAPNQKWKVVIANENYRIKDFELVDEIRYQYVFTLAKLER